ncbi:MAG: 3-isopropylmalate dehydrogenase, partial [Rhodospirillales bacterium]|nr:3-isopropylmalate dehydrogenase [Rhodospirillales bacterium]
ILRELTGGVYFGQPRGIETRDGVRYGFDNQIYSEPEVERIAKLAFELARKRNSKVHSVEKANVMESGVFWRQVVTRVHGEGYKDVELQHMYADNCAMQLVRWPKQFDVIVTDNLFGDLLSDCAAMLTGSLGMLPSASLGEADESGRRRAMYEPVHGSAPDIAGQGIANPLATILSFSMMLRYSFDMAEDADLIDQAAQNVLNAGLRTADIMQDGKTKVSTKAMGEAIVAELDKMIG